MTQHDLALLLLKKAREDERAVDRLVGDVTISDEIIGFHLQQAAEKLIKAVLAEFGHDIHRTHSLAFLFDRLIEAGVPAPQDLSELIDLTPFAVEFRYGVVPVDGQPLDRHRARSLVAQLRGWVESVVPEDGTSTENG